MKILISDHFTLKKLIKFVAPSIIMMIFTSVYCVVDGFFVSNYAGKIQFAAVNLIMPFMMLPGAFGFMIGTGGNAIVSKTLGEGNKKKANEIFSMLVYVLMAVGIIVTVLCQIFLKKVIILLGADAQMQPYCEMYGRIILTTLTFFMMQNTFQSLLLTAGKPHLALVVTVAAGVTNMVLDFLFVGVFKWGVQGAATATAISEVIGGLLPLIYFITNNSSNLRLTSKCKFDGKALLKTCTNGSSELMTNVSMSLVNMLYNYQLLKFFGANGVAAYGSIMYVNFVFVSAFIGYSIGTAPIIGYNYGSKNDAEMKNIFKKSMGAITLFSLVLTGASLFLAAPISKIYVGYDGELFNLTVYAFRMFSTSYLIIGFNIFGSAFFTALNNGAISAAISFLRTLLFQILAIFVLPAVFGKNAIWLSITVAEAATLMITVAFLITNRKKYRYA